MAKREITAREAKQNLEPFGYDGPARWTSIDAFVKANPRAKAAVTANEGAFIQSKELGFAEGGSTGPSEEAIKKLADLQYLSYQTGVSTAEMNEALKAVGIDPTYNRYSIVSENTYQKGSQYGLGSVEKQNANFNSNHPDANTSNWEETSDGRYLLNPNYNANAVTDFLAKHGYTNSGDTSEFYGNNTATDPVANAFNEHEKEYGTPQINSSSANTLFAEKVMKEQGITADQTSYTTAAEKGLTEEDLQKAYKEGIGIAQNAWAKSGYTQADGQKDILNYAYKVDTTPDPIPLPTTIPITPNPQEVEQAKKIFGPDGKVTLPTGYQAPEKTIPSDPFFTKPTQPITTQPSGVTKTPTQMFTNQQAAQFNQRAIDQAQLIQPQTLAEKTAAGTASTIQQRMFKNPQGMTTYVTGTVGVDGKFTPTTAIPQGYSPVQTFKQGGLAFPKSGASGDQIRAKLDEVQTDILNAFRDPESGNVGMYLAPDGVMRPDPEQSEKQSKAYQLLNKVGFNLDEDNLKELYSFLEEEAPNAENINKGGNWQDWVAPENQQNVSGYDYDKGEYVGEITPTPTDPGTIDPTPTPTPTPDIPKEIPLPITTPISPTPTPTPTPTPIVDDGVTPVPTQTFGQNVTNQASDFNQRAIQQAQLIQPQTLAEKAAAGTASTIEQRLYRNPQGMSTYVTGTISPDGKFSPTTPVPQGYTQAQQMQEGGVATTPPTVNVDGKKLTKEEVAQGQADLTASAVLNPAGTVAAAPVTNINPDASGTVLSATTGQALGTAPIVTDPAQVATAATADKPSDVKATTADLEKAQTKVEESLDDVKAATSTGPTKSVTGQVQQKQKVDAQGNPMVDAEGKPIMEASTVVSDLDAAQLDKAQTVDEIDDRKLEAGEEVTGSAVDQTKVGEAFGTGEVKAASIQDELTTLMDQFEGGNNPPWAAGAMRKANMLMASRGLGASSMAGQAIIQAAMEAALPIAQIDTANKQQMSLAKAEQRAKFLQQDFDQAFQAKVINASKVSEIANMNFNADQQVALENAKMAQTVDLQNLNNKQALVMAEAAQLSQLETQNLSNMQQAQVENAKNFLQIDMANLNNEQQTEIFKAQTIANTILSDTASANANEQFNASSEMQVDQFNNTMKSQLNQFNSAQMNAMNQFNAGEANAIQKFNSELQAGREQFNASMYAQIAQANAKWRQDTETINTAAANQSNFQYAKDVNGLTNKAIDELWQKERDLMSYSFTASESAKDKVLSLILGDKSLESVRLQLEAKEDAAFTENVFDLVFGGLFG